MPIKRRDEPGDPLDRHISLIWSRKWLIIGAALVAAVLTYVVLLFVPETYRVTSEIFVNRLPAMPEDDTANPDTVAALLQSQVVIERVRDDFTQKFQLEVPPPIEKFARSFTVDSHILQDTTVRKQFSPVLQLQVEAQGTSQTRYIMDSWIRNFVELFGDYATEEAKVKLAAFQAEKMRLEERISEVERLRAEYDAKLPLLKKVMAEKLDLLTPSKLLFQESDVDTIKMDFNLQNPRSQPGLLERYTELQLQIRSGNAPTTATAELNAIAAAIDDAQSSITEAQSHLAEARFKQQQTIRHLEQLVQNQKSVNEAVSRFTVASAVLTHNADSKLPAGADVRALATPVTPETKVWPKRTLTAGIVGVAVAILTIFLIFARNFLTRISTPLPQ